MSEQIVTQDDDAMQVQKSQDGNSRCLYSLLNELWGSYSQYQDGSQCFYFDDLSDIDKRLLLSHTISASDYAYLAENSTRLKLGIQEERHYLSNLIDHFCEEKWHSVMEEAHEYRRGQRNDEDC